MQNADSIQNPQRRRRLYDDAQFAPWIPARQLEDCFLYYAPMSGFPCREREKQWYREFYDRLDQALTQEAMRAETFLRYKGVEQFGEAFQRYALKCQMVIGMGRQTNKPLPRMPTPEEIEAYLKHPDQFNYKDWIAEYLYWFVTKQGQV